MKDYLEKVQRLVKLEVYEKASLQISLLIWRALILFAIFFFLLMLCLALGYYLGSIFGSVSLGFLCSAGFLLLIILLLITLKRPIVNFLIGQAVKGFNKHISYDEDTL